ncbi:MAG: hypothetical protein PHU40_03910 [Sulfurimonas sp.]|nr:hypothetical protein [Sulfurimonas sp.]
MWLDSLKLAIIEKDTDKINELLETLPQLENSQEIEQAVYLLREAAELLYTLKDETAFAMQQLKKNKDFLNSTHNKNAATLDIRS